MNVLIVVAGSLIAKAIWQWFHSKQFDRLMDYLVPWRDVKTGEPRDEALARAVRRADGEMMWDWIRRTRP